MFKLYIMIIIVILMRKYYTLVQSGGQEGDGAGNWDVVIVCEALSVSHIAVFIPKKCR